MASMDERRKDQRKQTEHFLGVYHRETEEFIGRLVDLSVTGMMIRAVQNIDVNCLYEFRIVLPTFVGGRDYLELDAMCVWLIHSTKSFGKLDVGFMFTEISPEEAGSIQLLLKDALFKDSEEQPRLTLTKKST